jgi:hypothetical protein
MPIACCPGKNMTYIGNQSCHLYNLSPGTYVFEVKVQKNQKKALQTQLTIHIPPWYFTWYDT